jgi:heme O synthase-like polyprenyltransferase
MALYHVTTYKDDPIPSIYTHGDDEKNTEAYKSSLKILHQAVLMNYVQLLKPKLMHLIENVKNVQML